MRRRHRCRVRAARRTNATRLDRSRRGARRGDRRARRRRTPIPSRATADLDARQLSAPELRARVSRRWRDDDRRDHRSRHVSRSRRRRRPGRRGAPGRRRDLRAARARRALAIRVGAVRAHRRRHRADGTHASSARAARRRFARCLSMLDADAGQASLHGPRAHASLSPRPGRRLSRRHARRASTRFAPRSPTRESVAAVVVTRAEPVVAAETRALPRALAALACASPRSIVNAADGEPVADGPLDPSAPRYRLPRAEAVRVGSQGSRPDAARSAERQTTERSAPATLSDRIQRSTFTRDAHRSRPAITGPPLRTAHDRRRQRRRRQEHGGVRARHRGDGAHGGTHAARLDRSRAVDRRRARASDAAWARADIEVELDDAPGLVVATDGRDRRVRARARHVSARASTRCSTALVGRGVDVERDRAILRDLLALAPPGIDEVFALSILGDALAERRFRRIIVDPAPTGHLLRLLEMPAIALDWSHRHHASDAQVPRRRRARRDARRSCSISRSARARSTTLLHDHGAMRTRPRLARRTGRARRTDATRSRGARARHRRDAAIIWNRVDDSLRPLPATVAARQFCAEEVQPPPIGARAIREWSLSWRIGLPNS